MSLFAIVFMTLFSVKSFYLISKQLLLQTEKSSHSYDKNCREHCIPPPTDHGSSRKTNHAAPAFCLFIDRLDHPIQITHNQKVYSCP